MLVPQTGFSCCRERHRETQRQERERERDIKTVGDAGTEPVCISAD